MPCRCATSCATGPDRLGCAQNPRNRALRLHSSGNDCQHTRSAFGLLDGTRGLSRYLKRPVNDYHSIPSTPHSGSGPAWSGRSRRGSTSTTPRPSWGRRRGHPPNSRDRTTLLLGELVAVLLDELGSDPYPGTGHEIVGNRPVEGSFTDRSRLLHGRPTRGRPVRTPLSLSVLIPWMGGWVAKRAAAPGARQAPGTRGANGRTRRNRSRAGLDRRDRQRWHHRVLANP